MLPSRLGPSPVGHKPPTHRGHTPHLAALSRGEPSERLQNLPDLRGRLSLSGETSQGSRAGAAAALNGESEPPGAVAGPPRPPLSARALRPREG